MEDEEFESLFKKVNFDWSLGYNEYLKLIFGFKEDVYKTIPK